MNKNYLTVTESASLLGISRQRIHQLIRGGRFHPKESVKGYLLKREEVEARKGQIRGEADSMQTNSKGLKTGAVYSVEGHSGFLLHCDDAETRQVSTMHLYRNSAFGMIEEVGILNPSMEAQLRELDPKRKADKKLLDRAGAALESAKVRSALMYDIYKSQAHA